MNLLALPAPGDDLARYCAVREAHMANRNLACIPRPGPFTNFGEWRLTDERILAFAMPSMKAVEKRASDYLRRQRTRIKRLSRRKQAAWPPLVAEPRECPFCGSYHVLFSHLWTETVKAIREERPATMKGCVLCRNCGARSATGTRAEVVKLWNRRAA